MTCGNALREHHDEVRQAIAQVVLDFRSGVPSSAIVHVDSSYELKPAGVADGTEESESDVLFAYREIPGTSFRDRVSRIFKERMREKAK